MHLCARQSCKAKAKLIWQLVLPVILPAPHGVPPTPGRTSRLYWHPGASSGRIRDSESPLSIPGEGRWGDGERWSQQVTESPEPGLPGASSHPQSGTDVTGAIPPSVGAAELPRHWVGGFAPLCTHTAHRKMGRSCCNPSPAG